MFIMLYKFRYCDLLALAEDFDDCRNTRVLRRVASRRASEAASKGVNNVASKKKLAEDLFSESESSEVYFVLIYHCFVIFIL